MPGIGEYFSKAIVNHRDKLGGFIDYDQMLEIYGMDTLKLELIEPFFFLDTLSVTRLSLNSSSIKDLLKLVICLE